VFEEHAAPHFFLCDPRPSLLSLFTPGWQFVMAARKKSGAVAGMNLDDGPAFLDDLIGSVCLLSGPLMILICARAAGVFFIYGVLFIHEAECDIHGDL
jgi:hypothetical protein